jgi:hypothetical protein
VFGERRDLLKAMREFPSAVSALFSAVCAVLVQICPKCLHKTLRCHVKLASQQHFDSRHGTHRSQSAIFVSRCALTDS